MSGQSQFQGDIGLIGLGVMGQNLILNMAGRGFKVVVYNRTGAVTEEFMKLRGEKQPGVAAAYSLEELARMLVPPRRIVLMVKAGAPVDALMEQLKPYLEPGDITIDGGNSHYRDTVRRTKLAETWGLRFLGVGISGGEEGALKGPSIMPGGSTDAWEFVRDIFTSISAKVDGVPCCNYVGSDGAGHFVKMVHNGIEYADMQLISEAFFLLKQLLGLKATELQPVFASWNRGDLDSYLMEITTGILGKIDADTGNPMVEMIVDRAGQKGTGRWTVQEGLELGTAIPTIAEAVMARCLSVIKEERERAATEIPVRATPASVTNPAEREQLLVAVHDALYASKICAYAQGFALLRAACDAYKWNLGFGDIALLWRGGCIIRAKFLNRIKEAFARDATLPNLMLDPYFKEILLRAEAGWRMVVEKAVQRGIPIPAFSSALAYFDSYRQAILPANLLQAQRDYFGAHGYERIDRPGNFHTEWLVDGPKVESKEM